MGKSFRAIFIWLRDKRIILFLIASGFFWAIAMLYSLSLGDRLIYPDEQWYFNDYAQNIANSFLFSRDGIHPTAFHPPGYPLFLGVVVRLGLNVFAARLLNYAALYMSMLILYLLLKAQSSQIASGAGFVMALGYPVLFYTAGTLYPQTLGAMFFLLAVLFYWKTTVSVSNALLTGLFLGLSILIIPTFAIVLLFMIVFAFLFRKIPWKYLALLLLMVGVVITPWTIRNYFRFNQFVLVSTNFGTNFLIGNSPATTPNNGPAAASGISDIFQEAERLNLDEVERDHYFTGQALQYIEKDPLHYAELYLLKVLNNFNFRNDLLTSSESSMAKDFLMLATYGTLLVLGIARLFMFRAFPISKFEWFLVLLYLCGAFANAVVFTRIRYRLPFDYLLIAWVAVFIERVFRKTVLQENHYP